MKALNTFKIKYITENNKLRAINAQQIRIKGVGIMTKTEKTICLVGMFHYLLCSFGLCGGVVGVIGIGIYKAIKKLIKRKD